MIHDRMSIEEIGAIVCQALLDAGVDAFLSGGAVVSIYSNNEFESFDLDFVSFGDRRKIDAVMLHLGFAKSRSRLYQHPNSPFMVEFPGVAVQIGNEPIQNFAERVVDGKTLKLLTPTDCIKDRLASYIHWNDKQAVEQAALVACRHPHDRDAIARFCSNEGSKSAYEVFSKRVSSLLKTES